VAIKEAGVKFVTKDSTTVGEERRQHYIHGVPVGPSRDGIASMVLQDAMDKTKSLEKIMHASAGSGCNGGACSGRLLLQ
jgi:hypothetical protein